MSAKKPWGGRFQAATDKLVEEFTSSLDIDKFLYVQDIAGSKAHARMLAKQGILTAAESQAIVQGLDKVQEEIELGEFIWRQDLEDVHMNIENRLTQIIGPAGKKLHTARSRNDQVALDFRLYVHERLKIWKDLLEELTGVLTAQAKDHIYSILPGYTHLQPAQPVSLAHHLLAYVQMLRRDWARITDCQKRVRVSPLGAAALAGTTYNIDPELVAQELGFERVFANSMDAVADRDFVLEAVFISGVVMTHLSRFCEELVLWANPSMGFVQLSDAFATGSSIMPQKKNPDVAELVRGKTGQVYGELTALLTMLKGLPLCYNRDLQEDKEPFLRADKTLCIAVELMGRMIASLKFDSGKMREAVREGYLNATELADYLVGKGIAFRTAHHITGQIVAYAEENKRKLEELSLNEFQQFSPNVAEDVYPVLDYEAAVARRNVAGGTGFEAVHRQLEEIQGWLDALQKGRV